MTCDNCIYRKNIPLYSKCAGVPGRIKVGTAYYCGHPDMSNPVPVIPQDCNMHEDCPVINTSGIELNDNIQNAEVTG
ncbi:MAG: hypothetical protein R2741_08215 [Methanolobus sp.]